MELYTTWLCAEEMTIGEGCANDHVARRYETVVEGSQETEQIEYLKVGQCRLTLCNPR